MHSSSQAVASSFAVIAIASSSVIAQTTRVGTSAFLWELSTDNGGTWSAGSLEVDQTTTSITARLSVSWSADAGRWFASVRYDALWRSEGLGGLSDSISSISRLPHFNGVPQQLAVTRFGSDLNIDDARDTQPPGQGGFGIIASQVDPGFGSAVDDNPARLLSFRITLDGSLGERTVRGLPITGAPGDTIDRYVRIYTGQAINFPQVTQLPATLRVVPGPTSLALLTIGALSFSRRRR